jgi:hypothetical protein
MSKCSALMFSLGSAKIPHDHKKQKCYRHPIMQLCLCITLIRFPDFIYKVHMDA